jgi:hypothetical protein
MLFVPTNPTALRVRTKNVPWRQKCKGSYHTAHRLRDLSHRQTSKGAALLARNRKIFPLLQSSCVLACARKYLKRVPPK